MKKLLFAIVLSLATTFAVAAQSDIKIRKKTEIKMPGMPSMSESDLAKLPESARNRFKNMFSRESLVYIKGARMRTDTEAEVPSGMKMEKRRYSIIQQCDKQRTIQFNDKKKKYYAENFIGSSTGNSSSSKGSVTVSLNVTDTGERMQLFGYNARHLKQTMTIAPSGNACLKSKMEMEVDGWYADIPEFSCPYKPDMKGIQQNGNCEDEVRMEIKGAQLSGIALKEIRVIKMDGQTVTTMEEVVELTKTTLDAAFFEPPSGYSPANSKTEVSDETSANTDFTSPQSMANDIGNAVSPTLAPPDAGVAAMALQPKKAGMIRVGIAPPATDLGKDFQMENADTAVRNTIAVALKTEKVETVFLESGLLEKEAAQKECDFIFYSKVMRKKSGGGLFGSMGPMIAGAAASMIPGVGGLVGMAASTAITTATMAGGFKSKDEVGFEYKVAAINGTTILAPPATKQKAKKDGDDVLTPQIQQAATIVLAEISKPK